MAADPLDYLFSLEQIGIKLDLENIHAIVDALGHPERAFPTIHVAGTNGKGSVTALVDAGLRAAGYRSGRYTSPHLIDVTERFTVDGRAVSVDALRESVATIQEVIRVLMARGTLHADPTFFEVTTAAAFDLFRRARVDAAVCEVGLGGRLDATNILAPVATAIVSISLDHEQHLGTSVAVIAAEKAGIIKAGIPVVVGDLDPESDAVIARIAHQLGAPIIRASGHAHVDDLRTLPDGRQTFRLRSASTDYGPITLALSGAHQVTNALVAVVVLETLAGAGLHVSPEAVRRGLADVIWPGRLQRIVLDDGRGLLLDAAHNPAGARSLAAFLAEGMPRPLVFGAMRDKNIAAILEALVPHVSAVVTTRADTPRAADADVLAEAARRVAPDLQICAVDAPGDALAAAWKLDRDIVVAGSIFLLGDVLKTLGQSVEQASAGGGPSRP